jgi:hypothetical protein
MKHKRESKLEILLIIEYTIGSMYVSKILISKVKSFLIDEGYKVKRISVPNRFICAVIQKEKSTFFFKMALKNDYNSFIMNEYHGARFLEKNLQMVPFVQIRKILILDTFLFRDTKLSYIISEFIQGNDAGHRGYSYDHKKKMIKDAAQIAYTLSRIKTWKMTLRNNRPGNYLFQSAEIFADKKKVDENKLLKLIYLSKKRIHTVYGHGDFSPVHLYPKDNTLILIDTEHVGEKPEYYDVAHFYMRLRQNNNEKRLATMFLKEYISLLTPEKRKAFWMQFRPVLAERALGYLWEIRTDNLPYGKKKTAYPLLKDILQNTLI